MTKGEIARLQRMFEEMQSSIARDKARGLPIHPQRYSQLLSIEDQLVEPEPRPGPEPLPLTPRSYSESIVSVRYTRKPVQSGQTKQKAIRYNRVGIRIL